QDPEFATRRWLQTEQIDDRLPEDFDLRLATFAGHTPLFGRNVPTVELRTPNQQLARLYWVDTDHFRLSSLTETQTSLCTVRVYDLEGTRRKLVVLHSGGSLQPFFRVGNRAG
ncbi:MAG: hypothetical protein ACRCZF_05485, partial [Gemmataceae bacterium]